MHAHFLFRFRCQWLVVVLLLFVVGVSSTFAAGSEKNPVSAQSIFEARCTSCHGVSGKGNGWQARLFLPIPGWLKMPNLADAAYMQTRSDGQLFQMIKVGGIKGMPAYGLELTEPQIKDLIGYIRGFSRISGSPQFGGVAR